MCDSGVRGIPVYLPGLQVQQQLCRARSHHRTDDMRLSDIELRYVLGPRNARRSDSAQLNWNIRKPIDSMDY